MIELAFAALVAIGLPIRAWRRRGAPRRFSRSLIETLALIAILAALLWRNGVSPHDVGLAWPGAAPAGWGRFALDLLICGVVVIGPDAWAAWHLARSVRAGATLPAPDPIFAELLAGRHGRAVFVAAMIAGAIWEELAFRAVVLLFAPPTFAGLASAVVIGALLFGAQHLRNGVRRSAYAFGYGVMFSLLYIVTGNLIAVAAAHAAGNILSALQWTPQLERLRRTAAPAPPMFIG